MNGFTVDNARFARITDDAASSDGKFGFYLDNLYNASMDYDNATKDPIGAYITGSVGQSYGEDNFLFSVLEENSIGLEVNGLNQNITRANSTNSLALAELDLVENNTVGVLAENDSQVELVGNSIGFNGYGAIYKNSAALVIADVISQNNETGLETFGWRHRHGWVLRYIRELYQREILFLHKRKLHLA